MKLLRQRLVVQIDRHATRAVCCAESATSSVRYAKHDQRGEMDEQAKEPGNDILGQRAIAGTVTKPPPRVSPFRRATRLSPSMLFRQTARPPCGGEPPPSPIFNHFAGFGN